MSQKNTKGFYDTYVTEHPGRVQKVFVRFIKLENKDPGVLDLPDFIFQVVCGNSVIEFNYVQFFNFITQCNELQEEATKLLIDTNSAGLPHKIAYGKLRELAKEAKEAKRERGSS